METLTVRRVIAAPIADVFDWCATTTNYTRSPWVLRARLARPGAGAPYGTGAVRIHTWAIGWFRERITAYDPPYTFDYTVERSFPPARHELGRMTFAEVATGTEVTWTTTFQVSLPLIGPALTRALGRPVVCYVFGQILDAAAKTLGEGAAADLGRDGRNDSADWHP